MKSLFILSIAASLLAGCQRGGSGSISSDSSISSNPSNHSDPSDSSLSSPATISFQTMGKVIASRYADVKFEAALPVLRVLVHNGDLVRQGQLLAELNPYKYSNAVEQSLKEIDQARLQMQDVIISQGYDPEQMDKVPQRVRHIAEVKSGLLLAQNKLAAAQHDLTMTKVLAPFDGVVANVTARSNQLAQVGELVCRVVSQQQMEVEFRVMETDLRRFPKGAQIQVQPVADESTVYEAQVTEINPIVDEQGTVLVRAHVVSPNKLFDGMHVSVNLIENQP